jgi:hypothetical protein
MELKKLANLAHKSLVAKDKLAKFRKKGTLDMMDVIALAASAMTIYKLSKTLTNTNKTRRK